jgi:predicted permease
MLTLQSLPMSDSLLQAYLPLLVWPSVGLLLFRVLPDDFPRRLGRFLYWVGIPLEIFALAHQTDFSQNIGLAPLFTIIALVMGLVLALVALRLVRWAESDSTHADSANPEDSVSPTAPTAGAPSISVASAFTDEKPFTWADKPRQGSFVLSSMISNTGFVGLAIVPALVSPAYLGWVVFYSVTHNLVGTYGVGVFIASWFGRGFHAQSRWQQVRDVVTVPSLWAFLLGYGSHRWSFVPLAETLLQRSVWFVIPLALLLMGMRLSQLKGWDSLKRAVVPAVLKMLILPGLVGGVAIAAHLPAEACLVVVLMSGMPSAFAGLILAEEYELDRDLIASSIALSTAALLITIPLWLGLFAGGV